MNRRPHSQVIYANKKDEYVFMPTEFMPSRKVA